jgi:hypothetical protein
MNAADFVRRLSDGSRTIGIEVTEPVDLANAAGPGFKKKLGAVDLQEVHFHGDVSFANCNFDGGITFRKCIFDGSLNLGKTAVGNGILLTECRFDVAGTRPVPLAIILDDARIRGDLVCDRVTANGCISARRLRLAGNIEFTECTVNAVSLPERAALDLSDAKIKGSVILETGQWPSGSADPRRRPRRSFFCDKREKDPACVLLRGADVTDMVKLSWAEFQGEVDLAFMKCRSLESEVGIFSRPAQETKSNAGQTSVKPEENIGGASIDGRMTLSGGDFGLIHLHGISISGEMMLIAWQSGQIIIEDGICPAEHNEHFIVPSTLDHFIMSSWRCSGFLHLHAAKVRGESNTSPIRGVVIRSSVIDHSLSLWPGLRLQRLLERYLEAGCKEKERPRFFVIDRGGFFLPVECRGDYRNLFNRWRRRMVVRGNVSIDHCSIGDDLLLTGIDLIANSETDDGRIEVVDSKIDGNLVFRSPISFLADAQVDAPLLRLFAQRLAVDRIASHEEIIQDIARSVYVAWQSGFAFVPACCHMLDTTGLKAVKIDLTGLCIRRPLDRPGPVATARSAGKRDENLPNAIMSNIEVGGKIGTFARLSTDATEKIYEKIKGCLEDHAGAGQQPMNANWPRELLTLCFTPQAAADVEPLTTHNMARAGISGSLDLQHSMLSELLISDASFRQHEPHEKAAESGIVLDYAQISKLYVARSQLPHAREQGHNGFPVPVSLLDFSVKTWFLEDEETGETFSEGAYIERETTTVDPYLDLLENDPAFRMSSYLAVEKSLRDRGLTDEAREIFIAGNYRDVRTESVKNQPTPDHNPQPAASADAHAALNRDTTLSQDEKIPLPGLLRPETWRNWKVWRRTEGRYRGSTVVDVRRLLKSPNYRELARCLISCIAVLLAAALLLIAPSPISLGYVVVALLSLLTAFGADFLPHDRQDSLVVVLSTFGLLYALMEVSTQQDSLLNFGYLAAILLSLFAVKDPFGLPPPQREQVGIVVYGACIVVGIPAIFVLLLAPFLPFPTLLVAVVYLVIVLCLFFTLHGNLFRLRRPRREYLGFVLCLAWCLVAVGLATCVVTERSFFCFGALAVWLAALFPLFAAMRCFFDQMYWSLVDYGTSAIRLAGVIFILMAVSFAFVSGNRHNFESTLLARSIASDSKRKVPDTPAEKEWVFGERVWMTLRYHVPLVGAIISDEWQPSAEGQLRFAHLTDDQGNLLLPAWWSPRWASPWPRARLVWGDAMDELDSLAVISAVPDP